MVSGTQQVVNGEITDADLEFIVCKFTLKFKNMLIARPDASEYPGYNKSYIDLVEENDLISALKNTEKKIGKWTDLAIKEKIERENKAL